MTESEGKVHLPPTAHKTAIAVLVILGIPTGLFLAFDALMLRSRPTPLGDLDYLVCLGGAFVILLLEAWGLKCLLRDQFQTKRRLKQTALVITIFLFVIWQVSVVLDLGTRWRSGVWAFLSHGCLETGMDRSGRSSNWLPFVELPSHPPFIAWERINWWPKIWRSRSGAWESIRVPLWMPYLAVLTLTISFFWRNRKLPSGFCQNCSYNLTGNISGVCPECGKAVG